MRFALCLAFVLLAAASGCGDAGGRVRVTGTVRFDGQPLEAGKITFGGEQGAAGAGEIVDGEFSLDESGSESGVLPGKYSVLIHSWIEERGSVREDGSFSPGITRIPLVYLDPAKSGLTAEVKAGESNHFEFDLKSSASGTESATAVP